MKREDYEWLVKILASVVNAGERGNEVAFYVTCSKTYDRDETTFYLTVNQFKTIDNKPKLIWSDSWMSSEGQEIFGDLEEIVKVVNAL